MSLALVEPRDGMPLASMCHALGVSRSTVYARRRAGMTPEQRAAGRSRKASAQPRALSEIERQRALKVLYS